MIKYLSKHIIRILAFITILVLIGVLAIVGYLYPYVFSKTDSTDHAKLAGLIQKTDRTDVFNEDIRSLMDSEDVWGFILNPNGEIVQEYRLPKDFKRKYEIVDIVRFTRYYLNDYPVFTYVLDDSVLVLGYPKGSYDKTPFNYYNFNKVMSFVKFFLVLLAINLIIIIMYYLYSKKKLFNDIKPIQDAVNSLAKSEKVELNENQSSELRDIVHSLNIASDKIEELKRQRERWIRGISHDIRTPLTKILWAVDSLRNSQDIDSNLNLISLNVNTVSSLVDDLNLTTALGFGKYYDNFKKENPVSLLRSAIAKCADANPDYSFEFENSLNQISEIYADSKLLTRAISNILNNSVSHNKPCKIVVKLEIKDNKHIISIADSGSIDDKMIEELNEKYHPGDYNPRGLGIVIVKQIIAMHGGEIEFSKSLLGGLKTEILI